MANTETADWGRFIEPQRIEHLAEFGDRDGDGHFGYAYNFLDYSFAVPDAAEPLQARAYLDEIDLVFVNAPNAVLHGPFYQDVLCYLRLRYARIKVLSDNRAGFIEIAQNIIQPVDSRLDRYLNHSDDTR